MAAKSDNRSNTSTKKVQKRRLLRVVAIFVIAAALLGAAGYWLFVGWRARDLALKARANLESANYRFAWLQANSARSMRPDDPEVLKTSAIVGAAFGRKESLDAWRRLADAKSLTPEEQEQRARAAIRFGDEAQFEEAVAALDAEDKKDTASRLRAASRLSRGDLDATIEQVRLGISLSDDPQLRLDLAKLLLRRYVDDLAVSSAKGSPARLAFAEMTAIVSSLQGDPQIGLDALAFGLSFLLPGAATQKSWADAAMARMETGNPALLPAATVLIDNKYDSAENLHARMRAVFDAAPLDRRASYAAWLSRHGLSREALTMITAQEAGESPRAFLARTEALGKMDNWDAVVTTAEQGGNVTESVRLLTRARAEYALRGNQGSGAKVAGDAMRAASREGTLAVTIQTADSFGAHNAVSDALVELSGDGMVAGPAFRSARERFAATGDQARMNAAFQRASQAVPEDLVVRDYARYSAMIEDPDSKPDLDSAARDAAAEPANPLVRVTQALALLRHGQAQQAMDIFGNITIFYDRLPPGSQAVVCAVLAANGQDEASRQMVQAIDVSKLLPGEKALIENLR